MRIYSATDTGLVRSSNQDAAAHGSYDDGAVWAVVCDGMGGANGGEFASSRAVEVISRRLSDGYRPGMSGSAIRGLLESAVLSANVILYEEAQSDIALYGMGTTVVIAFVRGDCIYTAHAGDSRAYKLSGDALIQLTTDHSMVQELVQLGQLTQEQANNHPRKNIITRALGIYGTVEIDFTESQFDSGDIVLLCSDGLSNCVRPEDIVSLAKTSPMDRLCDEYIRAACENGGGDNITAVIICE